MATATKSRKSPARKPAAKSSKPRVDVYQKITDQVIEMLEAGTAPWHKPWKDLGGVPVSMSTKKPYRGINILLLGMAAQANGFSSRWWGTYEQIAERGGQVRKGEKSTKIVFWGQTMVEDDKNPGTKKKIFFLREFSVFNAVQADGELGLPAEPVLEDHDPIEEVEQAIAAYYETGPTLRIGGDIAAYSPTADMVLMPERKQFDSAEAYYAALFHETTHSTGHESRLKRKGITELGSDHAFGSESYADEELVAEMGSTFLAGITGVAVTPRPNSAAYLANWLVKLRNDRKLIVHAAARAQKAADLVLGITHADTDKAEGGSAPVTGEMARVA